MYDSIKMSLIALSSEIAKEIEGKIPVFFKLFRVHLSPDTCIKAFPPPVLLTTSFISVHFNLSMCTYQSFALFVWTLFPVPSYTPPNTWLEFLWSECIKKYVFWCLMELSLKLRITTAGQGPVSRKRRKVSGRWSPRADFMSMRRDVSYSRRIWREVRVAPIQPRGRDSWC